MSTSASALLSRMVETYANAKTYVDHGEERTLFTSRSGEHTSQNPFATSFERPWRFRFEFIDSNGKRTVVGRSKQGGAWEQGPDGEWESLDLLLAKLAGVSGGTSRMIPGMLLPEELRSRFVLRDPTLEGEETVAGSRCHRIAGLFGKEKLTLWIDAQSGLLRRTFQQHHFGMEAQDRQAEIRDARLRAAGISDELRPSIVRSLPGKSFDTETTITFEPVLNGPVTPTMFEYRPFRV